MQRFKGVGRLSLLVMLTLSASASTGCSHAPTVILDESKVVKLTQNESAPFSGWLLSESAMARLLEVAEGCQEKTGEN